ncbi:hypothetical protein J3R82DRAFT_41 [Butyriboletus roseoflavus]|nr:hypothetical protein J3R82DRAFT_41 [Butyriboletus roseoflavus]
MEHPRENYTYKCYKELLQWVSSIREVSQADLTQVIQQLGQGADSARSDDTHLLKVEVANWLMRSSPKANPPLIKNDKSRRGFYNDSTGRLLCPIDYDWNNAIHRKNIRELHPDFLVSAQSWPTFLYTDYQFDP